MGVFAFLAHPAARFGLSGTLILCYALVDAIARRRGPTEQPAPTPHWVTPLTLAAIAGYYALIGPTGDVLWGGAGNALGLALCVLACGARWLGTLRHPRLAARAVFYTGLPLAVGVPWGLLVLSLPGVFSSVWVFQQASVHAGRAGERALGR